MYIISGSHCVEGPRGRGPSLPIRSGGATNRIGSNNIEVGITIDLSLFSGVNSDTETGIAKVGPGAIWPHVYEQLDKHDRVVAGGRGGSVGVGGYTLGGGLSFYSRRCGFACDNIVAYEVALADGSNVTSAADQHADLSGVLKGASNNFGLVTSFSMKTYRKEVVWGGVSLKPTDVLPAAADAFFDFTANARNDPDSTTIFVAAHQPQYGGANLLNICYNTAGIEKPQAFEKFLALPEAFSDFKKSQIQDWLPYAAIPDNFFNIWYTVSIKNDASIVAKASELLFQLGREMAAKIESGDFTCHCAFQPIPRLYTGKSLAAGGNILGLDRYPHDAVMLQASASVRTPEALVGEVRAFAAEKDALCPWTYLN
ncbi:unnamed protein product [Discula destructiva]